MSLANDLIFHQTCPESLNSDQSSANSQCSLYADDGAFTDYLPNVISCNQKIVTDCITRDCHQMDQYNEENSYSEEIKCQSTEDCEIDLSSVGNEQESSESLSSSVSMSDSEDSLNISESESITDVTPLHSPYCHSPLPRSKSDIRNASMDIELLHSESENPLKFPSNITKTKEFPKTAFVRRSMIESKTLDMNELLEAVKQLESHQRSRIIRPRNCVTPPLTRRRKCLSFSNDEICNIDQENQRLFKKLISIHSRKKSKYSQNRVHQAPSAIHRRRPQPVEVEKRLVQTSQLH